MGLPVVYAASFVGGLSKRLKTPSEKRAAKIVPQILTAANTGNMNAVAILDVRRSIGISKERAVWSAAYNQINPAILAKYAAQRDKVIASIPPGANANPESAAEWALNTPVAYEPSAAEQALEPVVTAARQADINARDAFAQAAERVGVGGGAAIAQGLRGAPGPLDKLIEFGQKPGGTLVLIAGGIVALVFIGSLLRR